MRCLRSSGSFWFEERYLTAVREMSGIELPDDAPVDDWREAWQNESGALGRIDE